MKQRAASGHTLSSTYTPSGAKKLDATERPDERVLVYHLQTFGKEPGEAR